MKKLPAIAVLHALFRYDAETGFIYWRRRDDMPNNWNARYAGKPAGTLDSSGYLHIRYDGKFWQAHRIAWALATGEDPYPLLIDHRNRLRTDNRLRNLRKATQSLNHVNSRVRGKWGKGVYRKGNRFIAQTKVNGAVCYIGSYQTPEEAHAAYLRAVNDNFGEGAYAA